MPPESVAFVSFVVVMFTVFMLGLAYAATTAPRRE